ncbi:15508_t:CDS:2 [Funneliformis mosseae]|uniref:15508_t:CDS:1 n=1 Tax=Funneliformis mosseae TaxID=27381 RepID=A0A9N8VZR9_FUNMO|nr:15508_t:CDS:2 [Funneliformis mosseae]
MSTNRLLNTLYNEYNDILDTDLCNYIEDELLDNKGSLKKNFVLIQNIADQFIQFGKLVRFCKLAIRNDPLLIFKADDFTTIKQDMLLDVLKKTKDSERPIKVWDRLMEWSIAQSDDRLPTDIKKWTNNEILIFKEPLKNIFDVDFYIQIIEYYSFNASQKRT